MARVRVEDMVQMIPIAGCWIWAGYDSNKLGYGGIRINGRQQYAHRFSWEEAHGAIPSGMCVLHRCDVPACVNPHHLFLGSKRDNTRDMMHKRRDRFVGERNPGCKLTDEAVQMIRAGRDSCVVAARNHGVSRSTITAIRRGETRSRRTNDE